MTLNAFFKSLAFACASAAVGYTTAHLNSVTGANATYLTLATTIIGIVGHWLPTPSTTATVTTSVASTSVKQ